MLHLLTSRSGSLRKKSFNIGRSLAGAAGGYLPNTITELWEPQRDFASLKLPTSGVRTVVAMSGLSLTFSHIINYSLFQRCRKLTRRDCLAKKKRCISNSPHVMVVSSEGLFYVYSIDLENGGECILTKSHNLLEGLDTFHNQSTFREDSTTAAPSSLSY